MTDEIKEFEKNWALYFYKANYYLKKQELEKLERKHEKLKEKFKQQNKKQ